MSKMATGQTNKYYAWSPILTGTSRIEAGTVVTVKDFAGAEDFKELVEAGAIRTTAYPKMPATYQGSPRSWRMEQIRRLREDLDQDELDLNEDEDEDEVVAL
jgi:hypothetical protein